MRQLTAGSFAISLLLAGCASQPTPQVGAQAAAPQPESVDMGGRWKLATPNAPSCGMLFERPPQGNEGSIKPEGGCPGKFFTSRHWALSGGQLTISDHNQAPLALLKFSDGQFAGKTSFGTPITLSRYPASAS
jgi:hypothetical protein